MTTQPKVSIIVPIYNVEKYFTRCMDSLLNQTLKDIEIILVDDESPDNCPAMCDEYARLDIRVKVIHKKNEGQGIARNTGLKIATGQYIAFVDSDDFVDVTMYEKLVNYAEKNKLDTCFCRFQKYYSSGKTQPIAEFNEDKIFIGRQEVDDFLMRIIGGEECVGKIKCGLSTCKVIFSAELIHEWKVSFISEREMASEEISFFVRYLRGASRVGWLNDALYYYYYRENSTSTSYSEVNYQRFKSTMNNLKSFLNNYYTFDFYKEYYYGQLLRLQKVIFHGEVARKDIPYFTLRNRLKIECNDPLLAFLKNDYSTKRLPFQKKVYIFIIKYKLVDLLYILLKLRNR